MLDELAPSPLDELSALPPEDPPMLPAMMDSPPPKATSRSSREQPDKLKRVSPAIPTQRPSHVVKNFIPCLPLDDPHQFHRKQIVVPIYC